MTTTPVRWGPAAATWVAERDPPMSALPAAVEAAGRSGWTLHDAQWSPSERCRLAYRVTAGTGTAASFVSVDVRGSGWSCADYRDDIDLPGLRAAADPVAVADLLAADGQPVYGCRVEPVRYRPGSRCVLRYDVDTSRGPLRLYAKVFSTGAFSEVAAVHRMLGAGAAGAGLVAAPVAQWPELAVLVSRAVPGRPLSRVLADDALPKAERVAGAAALGGRLADLHALEATTATVRSADDQVRALSGLVPAVRRVDDRLADRITAVLDRLTGTVPSGDGHVLTHGGLRPGQAVLTGSGELTLLDLDGVGCGDGVRDLATAIAHLRWHGIKQPEVRDVLGAAVDAFLRAYETRAGRVDRRRLGWWYTAALLQVAARRYRRLDVADWPRTSLLVSAAEDAAGDPDRAAPRRPPPHSGDLLEPRQMTAALRTALAPLVASPAMVSVATADLLSAATDRRCVVRYTVRGLDGNDPVPVIGKAFSEPQRAMLLHEQLHILSSGPFAAGRYRVPRPVALLVERHLVLYRPGVGTPLDAIHAPATARGGVREAAGWLAAMHGSQVRLPRRLDPDQETISTREWADAIGRRDPELLAPAHRLAAGWVRALQAAGVDDDVPLHKDFHAGHVLVGDELCVIDLDEARNGDPALDVAHFCAYLEHRGDPGGTLGDAFLREYTAATGWHDAGSLAAWTAYTWLKIAKQLAVGTGPWRQYAAEPSRTPADAVARGLTWLAR